MQPLRGVLWRKHKLINSNEIVRIITELPRATPIETLREENGVEMIQSHVRRLSRKLYLKRQLGQFNPVHDNY
jgi:hypothetical protein